MCMFFEKDESYKCVMKNVRGGRLKKSVHPGKTKAIINTRLRASGKLILKEFLMKTQIRVNQGFSDMFCPIVIATEKENCTSTDQRHHLAPPPSHW